MDSMMKNIADTRRDMEKVGVDETESAELDRIRRAMVSPT